MELSDLPDPIFGRFPTYDAAVIAWAPGSPRFKDSWRSMPGWVWCPLSYRFDGARTCREQWSGPLLLAPSDVDPEVFRAWARYRITGPGSPYRSVTVRPLRPVPGERAAWFVLPSV